MVLGSPGEERVFALAGADRPYRLLVEAMDEGAATISASGIVLFANARFGELTGADAVVGMPALELVPEADRHAFATLLDVDVGKHAQAEFDLVGRGDVRFSVRISVVGFDLDGALLRSLVVTDLTERRRSQGELAAAHAKVRESEEFLRTALDAMLDGTSIASAIRGPHGRIVDFRIEYANPAIARLGRVAVADLIGHTLLEHFPAHVGNGLFAEYVRVVETGLPSAVEDFRYLDTDASGGPLDQYLDIWCSKLGDGFVQSVRDVTERRAAAAQLQESEYFFRETQRAASMGSYRATFSEDRWESSEVLDRIWGIDAAYPRTVAGWLALLHPDDRAEMERYLRRDIIERRQPFAKEYRIVRPSDGAMRWMYGLGSVALDRDGRVATLAGTVQDITDRRTAEAERRRIAAAIEQSVELVMITNASREIEYVNPAFERVSGYSRDEVIGQNPRIVSSGIHTAEFWATMWALLESGQPFIGELTNRCKDGSLFKVEAIISPLREANGEISSYVAVSRDVTRERVREAALTRLAHERELVAGVLAEVRGGSTPEATAISICGQLMRMDSVAAAGLMYFDHDGLAVPLAIVRADGVEARVRPLPTARAQVLRERAQSGPWAEVWVKRPWHPNNRLFTDLGITALGFAPILDQGSPIGLLEVATSDPDGEVVLTDRLPALLEFADLAGALIGPQVADLTEISAVRGRVESSIRYGAFWSVYQPIVDVSTGVRVGYEALTRFTEGRTPDRVFADARTTGLEAKLELATLARAIDSAAALPRGAWLSLNVSPDLVMGGGDLARLLRRADRPIVIEITEHVPVDDYAALVDRVSRMRPKVRIAVDDAGAGVANFKHIVELHPAFVKLDISIVRGVDKDLTRQALLMGLLRFAAESATSAIAEGVETQEELAMLTKLGITLVQGYLLGRPQPAEHWATSA